MKAGDIVTFRGKGPVFGFFNILLNLFDDYWRSLDWKPWHMGILWQETYGGWYVLEAIGQGVKINYYSTEHLKDNTRCWDWLDGEASMEKRFEFLRGHIDKRYDVGIYFWTMLQYLVRHYFNHRIPRLLDERFTCWELVSEWCEFMEKPIHSKYDCPLITDILKNLEECQDDQRRKQCDRQFNSPH